MTFAAVTDRFLPGYESNKISKFLPNIKPCVNLMCFTVHILKTVIVIFVTVRDSEIIGIKWNAWSCLQL